MVKIAIQGIQGSFHHEAAIKMAGDEIDILPCATFQKVFEAVTSSQADMGVVAVENSLHGSIIAVYRLLARNDIWVSGETYLRIQQYLIGAAKLPLESIQTVMSQSPAIAQCELWLEKNLPQAHIEETNDTADSVRYVVSHPDEQAAAIASRDAATIHKGQIIAGPINDDQHNYTRFFLIQKNKSFQPDANKTSIILETDHKPASLYNALGVFAAENINLSKLDSHPIANDQNHYKFYIDFDAPLDKELEHHIFKPLRDLGNKITVLGSYRSYD